MVRSDTVVNIHVGAECLGFPVEATLARSGERWVARAAWVGRQHIGMSATAREALTAALEPLGTRSVRVLLADLSLLEPSVAVAAAARLAATR